MNKTLRYFYTDFRIASLMQDLHGLKIDRTVCDDGEDYDGIVSPDYGDTARFYLDRKYHHWLNPRVGDILRAEHPANLCKLWEVFTPAFLEHLKSARYENVRVLQRNGLPFFWPESEVV